MASADSRLASFSEKAGCSISVRIYVYTCVIPSVFLALYGKGIKQSVMCVSCIVALQSREATTL